MHCSFGGHCAAVSQPSAQRPVFPSQRLPTGHTAPARQSAHCPPRQVIPGAQARPQPPQWPGSERGFTQPFAQAVKPGPHPPSESPGPASAGASPESVNVPPASAPPPSSLRPASLMPESVNVPPASAPPPSSLRPASSPHAPGAQVRPKEQPERKATSVACRRMRIFPKTGAASYRRIKRASAL